MHVPTGQPVPSMHSISPPSTTIRVPSSESRVRVWISIRLTDAIDGSASPRKPRVVRLNRSADCRIFDARPSPHAARTVEAKRVACPLARLLFNREMAVQCQCLAAGQK